MRKRRRNKTVFISKEEAMDENGKLKSGYKYVKGGGIIKT